MTDSVDEIRDIMVDCYNDAVLEHVEAVGGGEARRRPPGAPATAPDPTKFDAE